MNQNEVRLDWDSGHPHFVILFLFWTWRRLTYTFKGTNGRRIYITVTPNRIWAKREQRRHAALIFTFRYQDGERYDSDSQRETHA